MMSVPGMCADIVGVHNTGGGGECLIIHVIGLHVVAFHSEQLKEERLDAIIVKVIDLRCDWAASRSPLMSHELHAEPDLGRVDLLCEHVCRLENPSIFKTST